MTSQFEDDSRLMTHKWPAKFTKRSSLSLLFWTWKNGHLSKINGNFHSKRCCDGWKRQRRSVRRIPCSYPMLSPPTLEASSHGISGPSQQNGLAILHNLTVPVVDSLVLVSKLERTGSQKEASKRDLYSKFHAHFITFLYIPYAYFWLFLHTEWTMDWVCCCMHRNSKLYLYRVPASDSTTHFRLGWLGRTWTILLTNL